MKMPIKTNLEFTLPVERGDHYTGSQCSDDIRITRLASECEPRKLATTRTEDGRGGTEFEFWLIVQDSRPIIIRTERQLGERNSNQTEWLRRDWEAFEAAQVDTDTLTETTIILPE
jgi:hypothetical protein